MKERVERNDTKGGRVRERLSVLVHISNLRYLAAEMGGRRIMVHSRPVWAKVRNT
jgi:hypothetical protein